MFIIQSVQEPDKFIIQFSYGEMCELQNMTSYPAESITETLLNLILDKLVETKTNRYNSCPSL